MHSYRIGKVFGIEVRLDASWLFIFVLMTWNLTAVFASWHRDWPAFEPFAVALAASLLFFGCLLLHEFAHSLVAQAHGLRVRSITLFLFGGVSNIEHEPPSPRTEFLIAVVGPLTSLALGAACVAFALATTDLSLADIGTRWSGYAALGPVQTLVAWLGPMNFVIGIFNLIPAFPLDGGRVLRSVLWAVSGDLRTATRRVSAVGQAFGWLFIAMGIAMTFGVPFLFFGTGLGSGLWLAFIGWFLHSAAAQSQRRLAIDDALAGHTVEEVMRRDGPTVSPDLPLSVLVHDYLVQSDERALPVIRDGELLGLVSASDVRSVAPADWPARPVASVMQPRSSLVTAEPRDGLAEAFARLAQGDIGQLPVLDGDRLVGMLQRRDLARWLELAWGRVAPRTSRRDPPPGLSSPAPGDEPHARPV